MSRFGCSKTNGIPSTPSQKSIDVWRSAPTIVMWCTPWLWSFRIGLLCRDLALDELRLVLASLEAPPRHELDPVWTTSTLRSLSRIESASAPSGARPCASSTSTGSGGSCFTPAAPGRTRTWPLTSGANPLTTSRTAEGKTFTPRTMSMSSVRPTQRTRGPVRPHGHGPDRTSTWSRVRKRSSGAARWRRWVSTSSPEAPSSISRAAPVSGSISSGCTNPRAPRCMPSCSSHSPQSDTPMSPMPIASVTRAPQPSSSIWRKAGSPPPGSPATSTRSTLDPRRSRPRSAAHSTRWAAYEGVSTAASRPRAARPRASAARCCPCRTGCGRGRSGRRRRAPRRPRTARRCRCSPRAGPPRRPTPRSCAPSPRPSCRGRRRSAGCSSGCRWCRWSSRSGRSPARPTHRCAPIGFSGVHVSRISRFSVSGSCAISARPPAAAAEATPAAASFSR